MATVVDLFALAVDAQTDEDAIPVLHDALIEANWHDERVMLLCYRIPIVVDEKPYFRNEKDRTRWEAKRDAAIRGAQRAEPQWHIERAAAKSWARAVLSVMLFADWRPARSRSITPYRTHSPWRLVVDQYKRRWEAVTSGLAPALDRLELASVVEPVVRTIVEQYSDFARRPSETGSEGR